MHIHIYLCLVRRKSFSLASLSLSFNAELTQKLFDVCGDFSVCYFIYDTFKTL